MYAHRDRAYPGAENESPVTAAFSLVSCMMKAHFHNKILSAPAEKRHFGRHGLFYHFSFRLSSINPQIQIRKAEIYEKKFLIEREPTEKKEPLRVEAAPFRKRHQTIIP
jgi:hypothetical protein